MKGRLLLLPTYLTDDNGPSSISEDVKLAIRNTEVYLVEKIRTARRFIADLKLGLDIDRLAFFEMGKHAEDEQFMSGMHLLLEGKDVGVISEAGLPGIADPGQLAVQFAHAHGIEVIPYGGGNSIILGLISSGFNGQKFTFHGYLPIDKSDRIREIKKLEQVANQEGTTQLFMETPYRNDQLLEVLFQTLHNSTILFVGANITGQAQICASRSVEDWKKSKPKINKIPAIFGIGRF